MITKTLNITSAKYQPNETRTGNNTSVISMVVDGQTFYVPTDPANIEYAEIMRQVAAGELTIADAD
tara:strand:- start:73 stop:270 length:198 start_codon:yes stop_codon:yes gene_type:complete